MLLRTTSEGSAKTTVVPLDSFKGIEPVPHYMLLATDILLWAGATVGTDKSEAFGARYYSFSEVVCLYGTAFRLCDKIGLYPSASFQVCAGCSFVRNEG